MWCLAECRDNLKQCHSFLKVLAWMNKDSWAEEEDNVMYEDGEDSPSSRKERQKNPLVVKGIEDNVTMVEVSVRVWFTKEFAAIEDDVQGYIDTCFEEANGALANSLVPMRLKHFGTKLYEGEEIFDGGSMLKAFRSDAGKNPATKDAMLNTADAAILLTRLSDVCGIAYFNTIKSPFAMATHSCARYGTNKITTLIFY